MTTRTKSALLNIVIAGDSKGATVAMNKVGSEAQGLGSRLGGLAKSAGALLAGGAAIRWAQQSITTYRTVGGEMLKLQRLTGASEDAVSGLWVAAQQSGVPFEKLATSLGIFSSKLKSKAVRDLGLDLTDAAGKALPLDQALAKVMDRVKSMPAGAERNALVRTLFGRSGTDLLPLLQRGGSALDEFAAKAQQLGITLNSDDIRAATANQREFNLAMTSVGFVVGKEVLPAVTGFMGVLARNLPPVVQAVSGAVDVFKGLPGPVQATAGALVAIAPAAKVLGTIAVPFKMISTAAKASSSSLTMFRLGLAGATEKGAGASNAIGGLVAKMGGLSVAAPIAGAAMVGLGAIVYALADDAAKAAKRQAEMKSSIDAIRSAADAAGVSLDKAFSDVTVPEWVGQNPDILPGLKAAGTNLTEFVAAAQGSDAEFKKWLNSLGLSDQEMLKFGARLIEQHEALKGAKEATDAEAKANKELGVSAEDAAAAIGTQTTALERAAASVEALRSSQKQLVDSQQRVSDAHRDAQSAQADLAVARRAAAGDSDEYRDAVAAVSDAEEGVVDAQQGLLDAQRGVLDAQKELNDARAEAKRRLEDLAEAARDAALAEEEANLRVREARQEAERKAADPRATQLDRDRAALEVRKAEEEARQAHVDNTRAAQDSQAAQEAGIEGDQAVVDARRAVTEANQRVTAAEQDVADARTGVAEAERRAAKVISDARAKVAEAQQRAEDAMLKEVSAWEDLAVQQYGAVDGGQKYLAYLTDLEKKLDPGSPLAQRVQALVRDVSTAVGLGGLLGAQPGATVGANILAGAGGGDRPASSGPRSARQPLSITQVFQGTPTQQRRAQRDAALAAADQIIRAGRG